MSVMIERLEGMVNRYHEINEMMMSPEIVTDSRMLAKLGREQADLTQVVETYTEYKNSVSALEDAKALLLEDDKEIKEMAKMEIEELEPKIEEYLEKLEILLIPKDPNDSHNAIRLADFDYVMNSLYDLFLMIFLLQQYAIEQQRIYRSKHLLSFMRLTFQQGCHNTQLCIITNLHQIHAVNNRRIQGSSLKQISFSPLLDPFSNFFIFTG